MDNTAFAARLSRADGHSNLGLLRIFEKLSKAHKAAADAIGRIDHVTLLPNRVSFIHDFAGLASRAAPQCLVLLTLADAKHFNDLLRALGHAYSEDFVRAGAERLAGQLDAGTQVYHVSVLSLAFFAEAGPEDAPPPIVLEIVRAFRRSIVCQDIPVDTKAGVGITRLDATANDPAELLRATLAAAQDSRRSHQGWAWYDRKSDAAHRRAFRILADLPAAIDATDQLRLEFQPRICMGRRACVSTEALIRWNHPELGPISPAEFVSLAEATALITPLTHWVTQHALATAARWQGRFPGLKVSVNVSPKNLEEPDFSARLHEIAARTCVDPSLVELEFTEGVMGGNWHFMMAQFEGLRADGFEIAIDDFGSGYSNMSYLGKIPAKYLKIDQAFVRPLEKEAKNQVLVRAIIEMAHALNYHVVAEGIETGTSFEMLAAWGCDEGQGYFMSRPLSEAVLKEWLAAAPFGRV